MHSRFFRIAVALGVLLAALPAQVGAQSAVKLGLNYPRTGPYYTQGLDQFRASQLAVEEINAAGGILGRQVELVWRDSQSKVDVTKANVLELVEKEKVAMLFGGSASSVAVAAGAIAQQKGVPFFGTLTYSTATTGTEGHRFTFRECYDAWMGAKALSKFLKREFAGKKYFYITADYTWGWTTEDSLRQLTDTTDAAAHPGVKTPFPTAGAKDFKSALEKAAAAKPDVLVLVLFGSDMVNTINMANGMGLKKTMQLVVPNLTLGMAEDAGPQSMEGVLGALPWAWNIPYKYDYPGGKRFVEKFVERYKRYPDTSGASAYVIVHEYKAAVERANSFAGAAVVRALEGHTYTRLKDAQTWRGFDHQSVQTVYAVRCKSPADVQRDKFRQDYFEIIDVLSGEEAAVTEKEWKAIRVAAGKTPALEALPGE